MASPINLRLLAHVVRLAPSRTFWTAGSIKAKINPKRARTVRSSNKVKPLRDSRKLLLMISSSQDGIGVTTKGPGGLKSPSEGEFPSGIHLCQPKTGETYLTNSATA